MFDAAFASIESRSDHDHTDAHDSTSGSKSRRSIICDEECRGDEVGYEETIDEEVSVQSQVSSDSDEDGSIQSEESSSSRSFSS